MYDLYVCIAHHQGNNLYVFVYSPISLLWIDMCVCVGCGVFRTAPPHSQAVFDIVQQPFPWFSFCPSSTWSALKFSFSYYFFCHPL